MGLFLSMSGVIGARLDGVRDSITAFVESERMTESISKKDKGTILDSKGGVTVLYPESFMLWDECSEVISSRLNAPAFSFHIHDDDMWMYVLYSGEGEADRFNRSVRSRLLRNTMVWYSGTCR